MSLGLMIVSCNKETTESNNPPSSNSSCTLYFMAWEGEALESGFFWYTNYKVVVDGDTLGSTLSNFTTAMPNEFFLNEFLSSSTPLPTNGLSISVNLNQTYNIKILDGNSDLVIAENTGQFVIANSETELIKFNPQLEWNETNLDTAFPNGYDDEAIDIIGLTDRKKIYFTGGLIVAQ